MRSIEPYTFKSAVNQWAKPPVDNTGYFAAQAGRRILCQWRAPPYTALQGDIAASGRSSESGRRDPADAVQRYRLAVGHWHRAAATLASAYARSLFRQDRPDGVGQLAALAVLSKRRGNGRPPDFADSVKTARVFSAHNYSFRVSLRFTLLSATVLKSREEFWSGEVAERLKATVC